MTAIVKCLQVSLRDLRAATDDLGKYCSAKWRERVREDWVIPVRCTFGFESHGSICIYLEVMHKYSHIVTTFQGTAYECSEESVSLKNYS